MDILVNNFGQTDLAIRAAAERLTPGDKLIFSNGVTYQIAWPIRLPEYATIEGNGAWIDYVGSGSAIELKNQTIKSTWGTVIRNLKIKTTTGAIGINLHGPRYCRLENCVMIGFSEAGYKLDGGGQYGQYYYGAWYNIMEQCAAYYCQTGLILTGQHQNGQANANKVSRCTFMGETLDNLHTTGAWAKRAGSIGVQVIEGNCNLFDGVDVSRNDVGFEIDDKQATIISPYVEYCGTGILGKTAANDLTIVGPRFISNTVDDISTEQLYTLIPQTIE